MLFKKVLMFLCLVPALGLAAPQASNGRDVVTLSDKVCSNPETLQTIPVPNQKDFRNADVLFNGVSYKACWTIIGDSVLLAYPDGDQGLLPTHLFKEAGV